MGKEHAEMESLPRVAATVELARFHVGSTLVLFFASGFAGLVYEVLWMKELGLLFGNTSHAAATTLAAFFLGLVAGARFWGRRAGGLSKPLAAYALLEAGVSLSALAYFLLLDLYHAVYAPLFQALGDQPALFLAVKFLLAMVVLFPPSFFMGGTLPMMSQHLVRSPETLGRMAPRRRWLGLHSRARTPPARLEEPSGSFAGCTGGDGDSADATASSTDTEPGGWLTSIRNFPDRERRHSPLCQTFTEPPHCTLPVCPKPGKQPRSASTPPSESGHQSV